MSLLKKCSAIGAVLLVMSLSMATEAAPIVLFNTGVDAGGALLTPGDLDPHWTITTSPDAPDASFSAPGPAITQLNHPAWLANGPDSNWISVTATGTDNLAPGDYVYETTFDLTGLNPATAAISGQYAADNTVADVLLNGVSTGSSGSNFLTFNPFTISSGFIAGVNTLEFVVTNQGASASPFGFRAELSGTANVIPEPASSVLTALGLLGLTGLRRRRLSK